MDSCTVSGNSASRSGGGIHNRFVSLELTNSTVSGNAAADGGGGIVLNSAVPYWSEATLKNVTATGNTFGGVNSIYQATSFENTLQRRGFRRLVVDLRSQGRARLDTLPLTLCLPFAPTTARLNRS